MLARLSEQNVDPAIGALWNACPVECLPNGIYFSVYSIGAKPIPLGPFALCAMHSALCAMRFALSFNRGLI